MMSNLFSSFDPSTLYYSTSLNWLSSFLMFFFLISVFWMIPSRFLMLINIINNILYKEMKILNNKMILLFISLFWLIMLNNFLGLFPYIFTSSSHLIFTLSFSLPLWLTFMIYGWFNSSTNMLAHLIPNGTPAILMPFMVCIETISNFIRPGTLAVRLTANMIAGHLLITLLGNSGSSLSLIMINILIIIQILLLCLELAVSFIQAYVFTLLSILYCSEIN